MKIQIKKGKYKKETLYGNEYVKIINAIKKISEVKIQKQITF